MRHETRVTRHETRDTRHETRTRTRTDARVGNEVSRGRGVGAPLAWFMMNICVRSSNVPGGAVRRASHQEVKCLQPVVSSSANTGGWKASSSSPCFAERAQTHKSSVSEGEYKEEQGRAREDTMCARVEQDSAREIVMFEPRGESFREYVSPLSTGCSRRDPLRLHRRQRVLSCEDVGARLKPELEVVSGVEVRARGAVRRSRRRNRVARG